MTKIEEMLKKEAESLNENPEFDNERDPEDVCILIKFSDGHVHGVYPEDFVAEDMIKTAMTALGIDESKPVIKQLPRRIIFHNRQAIGDILMMTPAIRDFKKAFPEIDVKVETTAMHIWDYNPNICKDTWDAILDGKDNPNQVIQQSIQEDRPIRLYIGSGKGTNASNRSDNHFANAYRISIENLLDVKIPQGAIRPDIYMTKEEYDKPPLIEPPYWLITAGEKGDWTCKTFSFSKWQEVVERLPEITFVQLGSTGHKHPALTGKNVINYIGKTQDRNTGIRDLFNLFLNCEGSMGLVSFQMHLAAAFNKPAMVMAGAREPVWFTRYPGQNYLASDGCLPCTVTKKDEPTACWFCDLKRCPYSTSSEQSVPRCVDIFSADEVIAEIKRYYTGGRLSFDKPVGKSKLISVIDTPTIKVEPKVVCESGFPLAFGGGSLTDRDWKFIKETISKYNIKTVLEFGAGLSTLLLNKELDSVVTYETNPKWIKDIKAIDNTCDIRLWDGKNFNIPDKRYDMTFVDGPAGGESREFSTSTASKYSDIVIIHDAGRVPERKWQDKYLKDNFDLASKGGHRCHLWVKKSCVTEDKPTVCSNNKTIRVMFNGRGEGGAERSTTWIMNKFIEKGWNVQYFSPSGNPSGTFKKYGNKAIELVNDNSQGLLYDILFLYTNDWVWDFKLPKVQDMLKNIEAKRKVMAINYRIGDIGTQKALWTKDWDNYILLNSSLESILLERSQEKTIVLPPPTDLTEYYKNNPDYNGNLKLIRHSSQGDAKYPKDFNDTIERILSEIPSAEIFLMPAPSFLADEFKADDRVHTFKRNQPEVKEFLSYGNVFWYILPKGYTDQGPKTIMEGSASGLAVIADNHSGAKDRVVKGTGFLCDSIDDHLNAMHLLNDSDARSLIGNSARTHARDNYNPDNWIREIIG